MSQPTLTAQDREWRAQDDARTLSNAKQIMADGERLSAAQDAARIMAEREEEEARAMRSVASGGSPRKQPQNADFPRANGPRRTAPAVRIADSMAKVPLTYIKRK